MVRIADNVEFAPGIRFSALDLSGKVLPRQYEVRIREYYLEPARRCAEANHAFASGLLVVSAIDAISRIHFGPNRTQRRRVGVDFQVFARTELPSFRNPAHARVLYEDFRNGLVHEARLKNGAQFQLSLGATADFSSDLPRIDPAALLGEVGDAFERLVTSIEASQYFQQELVSLTRREFAEELR